MNIAYAVGALALSAVPIQCTGLPPVPSPMPACEGEVVYLPSEDATMTCNINPPQVLVYYDDDPGPVQEEICRHHGGIPTWDWWNQNPSREVCWDIDY